MAKDFQKKEPTKNEKMLFEVAMHQQMLDRSLATNSAFIAAVALMQNIDPKKVAEFLTTGHDKIKEYSDKINEAIGEIEKAEKEKQATENNEQNALEETTETKAE